MDLIESIVLIEIVFQANWSKQKIGCGFERNQSFNHQVPNVCGQIMTRGHWTTHINENEKKTE